MKGTEGRRDIRIGDRQSGASADDQAKSGNREKIGSHTSPWLNDHQVGRVKVPGNRNAEETK